jgi:hypothetical protein
MASAQQSTRPSPSAGPFVPGSAAACRRSPWACVLPTFLSTIPRSDSWHRLGRNFARASIRAYLLAAPGRRLCSPLARPFVCGCHTISTIPSIRTIPGLPGSPTPLPHRVARTHRGTTRRNPHAFAPIVQARPFLVFGRPVHLGSGLPSITTRWFSASPSDPPSREAPCPPESGTRWLQVPLGCLPLSRACPCRVLHTSLVLWPVRHYPHLWISTRGLGSSGTLTRLRRVLPGTHYGHADAPSGLRRTARLRIPLRASHVHADALDEKGSVVVSSQPKPRSAESRPIRGSAKNCVKS